MRNTTRRLWAATGLLAALLATLGALVGWSYAETNRSAGASLYAETAQRHLQGYLRGINEALITEGSSSALKLVQEQGAAFAAAVQGLKTYATAPADRQVFSQVLDPTWQHTATAVQALLKMKNLAASDDDAMLAYGKIAGRAETLVKAVTEIEVRARPAAAAAAGQMKVLALGAAVVTLLFMATVGRLVVQLMFNRLGAPPAQIRAIALQLAAHDLTVHIQSSSSHNSAEATVLDALRSIRENLGSVVGNVHSNANTLASSAAQIAQGNEDLSARTEQQAAALEQTTVSMEHLGNTVRQNADHAAQANRLAQGASEVAVRGGQQVSQVVQTMKGITDSSRRIADILGVIDGIAFQTNILALNAAVEAARAGEQGRGFAVVASEVRSLAQRSANAAKEIKTLIATSAERVEEGTALVDQAGCTMAEVVQAIARVSAIVGDISAASGQQSAGVSQVGEAIAHIDQVTQRNAALVEQSAAASESLKTQAQQLVQAVAVFKLAPVNG